MLKKKQIIILTVSLISMLFLLTGITVAKETLNVMTWGNYIDFAVPEFEEKYDIQVNLDYYSSETEAINKIKAGGLGSVDVVFLGVGYQDMAYKMGILQDLDSDKLENLQELYPFFQNTRSSYEVPFAWGTNSFMYNSSKITEDITSWKAMWDPRYKGKIAMIDRPEFLYRQAAIYLGLDMNDPSEETFQAVEEALREQLMLNRTFWSSGDDIARYMKNEEVLMAYAYDGIARQLIKDGEPIKYVFPEEGIQGWIDNLCLVAKAPNEDAAYKFIDYMISKDVQKGVATVVQYSVVNNKAAEELDETTRNLLSLDVASNILPTLKIPRDNGAKWNIKIQQMWTQLKAEAGN